MSVDDKLNKKLNLRKRKTGQIFSVDIIIAFFVLMMVIISSIWLWDSIREKLFLTEGRNALEMTARNVVYSLTQTVGDPPNWHNLTVFNDTNVYSLGIAKNRPWFVDEDKIRTLASLNDTNYSVIKKILTVRGPNYDFFLNVSKFNTTDDKFYEIGVVGIRPNSTAMNVIRIQRFGISDNDKSWVKIILFVYDQCYSVYCN